MGQTIPFDIVHARRFVLVDEQGRIRGGLGFTDALGELAMEVQALGEDKKDAS